MSADSNKPQAINIQILDKEYQVSCPPDEREALIRSAQVLDERMRAIRSNGGIIGLERIAVMAALNLTYDLSNKANEAQEAMVDNAAVQRIEDKLDNALASLESPSATPDIA